MDLNDNNLNYDLKLPNLNTPVLYSLIHLRDQCRNTVAESWLCLCVVHRKKTPEIWQNVFCMELATVATVTVWLMAVWFGIRVVPCFVCDVCYVCVDVHKHVWNVPICKYVNTCIYRLIFVCWRDEKENKKARISSAQW